MNARIARHDMKCDGWSGLFAAACQLPDSGTGTPMRREILGGAGTAGRVHIGRAREQPSGGSRIGADSSYRVFRCFKLEEHVHIFAGFLVPAESVGLNL